ncbi:MAG TPA: methionine--tRNA ligase, partial [Candidatus Aquilonibacter sp.]|nr:methionine--tRNA ligase [Candidatus Aquilonibacter sp.]
MDSRKFYITTAIPYVNAAPHIGHALEFVQADAIARYMRVSGYDVFLTTGADENSLKNVQAAEKLGITTNQLIDRNAQAFREMAGKVNLEFEAFARSSIKEEHWAGVEKIWNLCNKSGDIYKKSYKGLYCVGCEQFYTEKELDNGLCPEHKTRPELVEEENYFFRLSKYQKQIEELIVSGKLRIIPDNRKNEVLTFIREGLEDFSVSRSVKRAKGWGVPVPGDPSQIIYVWFDALGLYLTGIGYGRDEAKFAKWWPADLHVIGKGIIKFHALYWPGILLSAGIEIPKAILVHGYVTVEGQKMSKSIGNIVDPIAVVDKYGVDKIRYYLLKEIQTFEDGDFSEKTLIESINNELVGNIGNFIHRTL